MYYTGSYILVLLTAFLFSYLLIPFSKKSYSIALYLSFVTSIIIFAFFIKPGYFATDEFFLKTRLGILGIFWGATLIFLLGLILDFIDLPNWIIFLGKIIASIFLIISNIKIDIQFIPLGPLNFILTILWVILIIEAFKRISSFSGVGDGIALVATVPLFFIGKLNADPFVYIVSFALIGTTLGFLRYSFFYDNFSIGKSGSMFLGFLIAALCMANDYSRTNPVAYIIPLLILVIPLYDTAVLIITKLKPKIQIIKSIGLFIKIGFTQTESILVCYFITFILGLISLVIFKVSKGWALVILGYTLIGIIFLHNKIYQAQTKDNSTYIKEIKRLFFNWLGSDKKILNFSFKATLKNDLKILSWLIIDIILINIGIYSAYLARFNGIIDTSAFMPYLYFWLYITAAHLIIFTLFKLYFHPSNFPKLEVILNTIKAETIATLTSFSIVYLFRAKSASFPSSVFIISWFFNIILISGWRVFVRYDT